MGDPVMEGLRIFYDALGGDYWVWKNIPNEERWNFSDPDPCLPYSWEGVNCEKEDTGALGGQLYVVGLSLAGFNLTGSLPDDSFVNFTRFISVNLADNNIAGPLPASVSQCASLEYLNVSSNLLTGCFPQSVIGLPNLTTLDYSDNMFQQNCDGGGSEVTGMSPGAIAGVAIAVVAFVAALLVGSWYYNKVQKAKIMNIDSNSANFSGMEVNNSSNSSTSSRDTRNPMQSGAT